MARPPALDRLAALSQAWPRLRTRAGAAALPAILVLALALRLFGINWDDGHLFHADERAVLTAVDQLALPPASDLGVLLDADESPWNPGWFPYGSLPLYLLKGVQLGATPFGGLDLVEMRLAGRAVSALADALTVLAVYLLGLRLADRRVALLASLLAATAVLHIQLSHFAGVDTLLTLFVVLSILAALRAAERRTWGTSAIAGAAVGLALATKASAAPLMLPLFLAHLPPLGTGWRQEWTGCAARLGLALGAAAAVLIVGQPYMFLDWEVFRTDLAEQSEMVRRIRDYPFTRQYVDTAPYLYHVRQLALFGLGLPLGLAAWAGLAFAGWWCVRRRSKAHLLALAWVAPYLLFVGSFETKFLRYMLPATPFLLLFGSQMLVAAVDWARARRSALAPWARAAVVGVAGATALYALAYAGIYSRSHPAVEAAAWMDAQELPSNTVVLREHWDDSIPGLGRYDVRELPLYNPDGPQKTDLLSRELAEADYLVLYSSRLYGSIARLPDRYPMSSRYYSLLFGGDLGYELVHFEANHPSLPGLALVNDTFSRPGLPTPEPLAQHRPAFATFDLGHADDSFVVFDHPLVLVFQNTAGLPVGAMQALFHPAAGAGSSFDPLVAPADEWAVQRAGGTWREIAPLDGPGARYPFLLWTALVYGVALATLPLGLMVFRFLPDRGFLLARVLGLLLTAYIAWLLASLNWVAFSRESVLLGLGALATLSLWIAHRHRGELAGFIRQRWRLLLGSELLFLGAFGAFVLIRMANPDLWNPWFGGEKPMDLAYLSATVRSTVMPPLDPWFSGGAINYYYFGHFTVAAMIKATGIPTTTAFNLAVPLFFALTAGGAFSLGYNLAEGARLALRRSGAVVVPAWSAVCAGLAAVMFIVILGNLDGAMQLAQGAWEYVARGNVFPNFDYWRSSRMMPPDPPGFEITEFPFFTFLFADLHAHLMALPLTLLVMGLGISNLLGAYSGANLRARLPVLGVLGLALGALWATNAWDGPTYLGLSLLLLGVGEWVQRRRAGPATLRNAVVALAWLRNALVASVLVLGAAVVLWLPYHLRLTTTLDGIIPAPVQTTLWRYLAIHGLFIFLAGSFLAAALWRERTYLSDLGRQLLASPPGRYAAVAGCFLLGTLFIALGIAGFGTVAFLLLLALPTGVLAWCWLRNVEAHSRPEAPYVTVAILMLGLAFAIGIGVDLVVVEDGLERLNTVFKLYLQAWVLFAVAGAYGLWRLLFVEGLLRRLTWPHLLWGAAAGALIIGALAYPVPAVQARVGERTHTTPWTLDGTAYMEEAVYPDEHGRLPLKGDLQAIEWLQANVDRSPVVLEGVTPPYRWGARVSAYTGLPTVVGWDWHEIVRKCGLAPCPAVHARLRDVERAYSTSDPREALAVLRKYDVSYVYVGELERLYYPPEGLATFAAMAQEGTLTTAYESAGVTIYRVGPPSAE